MRTKYHFEDLARLDEIDVYKEKIKLPVYPKDAEGNIKENVNGNEWLQFYLKNAYRELLVIAARYNVKNAKYYLPKLKWFPNKAMRFQKAFAGQLSQALQNPNKAQKIGAKIVSDWNDVDIENNDQSPLLKKYRYRRNRTAIKQLLIFLAKNMNDEGDFAEFADDKNGNQVDFFIAYASRVKDVMINLGVREKGYWTGMTSLLWEYSEMIKMRAVQFEAGLMHGQKWKGFYDAEAHKVETIVSMPELSKKQAEAMTRKWVEVKDQNKKYEKELQDVNADFKKYQEASEKEVKRLQDKVVSYYQMRVVAEEKLDEEKKKSANVISGASQSHSRRAGLREKFKLGKDYNQVIQQKDKEIERLKQEKEAWEATANGFSKQLESAPAVCNSNDNNNNNESEVVAENARLKERNRDLSGQVGKLEGEKRQLSKQNETLQKTVESLRSALTGLKAFVERIYDLFTEWMQAMGEKYGHDLQDLGQKTTYNGSNLDAEYNNVTGSYGEILEQTNAAIEESEVKFEMVADNKKGELQEESEVSSLEQEETFQGKASSLLFYGLDVKEGEGRDCFTRNLAKQTASHLTDQNVKNLQGLSVNLVK